MNYIFLRSKSDRYSLATQEKSIKDYMHANGFKIEEVEIEISALSKNLEDRVEFRKFLHSLQEGDRLFIYDLRALSWRIGELIQILNCIFNHKIELIVTKYGLKITKDTPSHITIALINQQREVNRSSKAHTGRPKGSISKSKYDKYRETIIQMIKEGKSVTQIAKKLNISRSSLRDYIISRELKEIAGGKSKVNILELPKIECKINNKG